MLRGFLLSTIAGMLIALLFFLVLSLGAQAKTIQHDNGGMVAAYVIRKNQLSASGEEIRIMGQCLSACTIYLGARSVCAGSNAVLGFHKATNAAGTRLMVRQWPQRIRAWVMAHGFGKRTIVLKGAELRRLVRRCK